MPMTLAEQEAQLDQLIKSGQNETAIKLLCQFALECAKKNDFEQAEAFRDQLYEVDSMALSELVKINETIEAEKSKALTPDHRRMWARFFEGMSNEEANAFFFALKEVSLDDEQIVLQQGNANECLYLVNKGKLKIIHEREDKQLLIQTLGPGDIFGEDTFFSINVCTVAVKSLSKVNLSYLQRSQLEGIMIQFPQLEEKLLKICGSGEKIVNWLQQKGMDRRAFKRYVFQTNAWFQVLTPDSKDDFSNSTAGELFDISRNGLSLYFKSKDRDYVRNLLGRTIGVNIIIELGRKQKDLTLTGLVQGVKGHPFNEYSVHLKLRQNLSEKAMDTIIKIAEKQLS